MDLVILAWVLIILIVILILVRPQPPAETSTAPELSLDLPIPLLKVHKFSIQTAEVSESLRAYADSWNYAINAPESEYMLYVHDTTGEFDLDTALDYIVDIAGISEYIAFSDSESFISRVKDISTLHELQRAMEHDIVISDTALETVINSGFPYRGSRGCILHRNYLDRIIKSAAPVFQRNVVMPDVIPRTYTDAASKIPKIIHQSFETRMLPNCLSQAAYTWINRNPEYEYRYYDNGDRREFIRANFDDTVLAAYDNLIPGAYRCDLWRLCAVYIHGGMYLDIKAGAIMPCARIIDADTDLVIANDSDAGSNCIFNAFFAAPPKSRIIFEVIKTIVARVHDNAYGHNNLYPTGPQAMGDTILSILKLPHPLALGKYTTEAGITQVFEHPPTAEHNRGVWGLDSNGERMKFVNTRHNTTPGSYYNTITGLPNYGTLWEQRRIYRNDSKLTS